MSENIEKFLEYVEKLKTEENSMLVESIVDGFKTLYEYHIGSQDGAAKLDDIMESPDKPVTEDLVSSETSPEGEPSNKYLRQGNSSFAMKLIEDTYKTDKLKAQVDFEVYAVLFESSIDSEGSRTSNLSTTLMDKKAFDTDLNEGQYLTVEGDPAEDDFEKKIISRDFSDVVKQIKVIRKDSLFKEEMKEDEEEHHIDDKEGRMVKGQLLQISEQADKLARMIDDKEQLKAWFQSKVAKAQQMVDDVYHYYENREMVDELNEEESEKPIMEEGPTTSDITPEMIDRAVKRRLAQEGNEAYKMFKQGVISEDEYNNYLGTRSKMIKKELEANPALAESTEELSEELMECAEYINSIEL
jgi:hypothetical protein